MISVVEECSVDSSDVSPAVVSKDQILEQLTSLGPCIFIETHKALGTCPKELFSILGIKFPMGLFYADSEAQWQHVKYVLIKSIYQRKRLEGLSTFEDAIQLIRKSQKIMIVTGAGISVSCGIPDFRSEGGLYDRIQSRFALAEPECVFDIEFFRIDPEPFFSFAKVFY